MVEHRIAAPQVAGSTPVASLFDSVAEWLRRLPAKQLGYARAGSNPAGVVIRVQQSSLPYVIYVNS